MTEALIANRNSINDDSDLRNWSVVTHRRTLRQSLVQALTVKVDTTARTGTFCTGVWNLLIMVTGNPSSVGLGIAMSYCGLPTASLVIVGASMLSWFSASLIIELGAMRKVGAFSDLAFDLFGYPGYILVSVAALIIDFGAMIANMLFVADNVGAAAEFWPPQFHFLKNRDFALAIAFAIVGPFCFLSDVTHLSQTSAVSAVLAVGVMATTVITGYAQNEFIPPPDEPAPFAVLRPESFTRGVTIIAFAVVCNDGVFAVFDSLKNNTILFWKRVSLTAFLVGLSVNLAFALGVYLSFYSQVTADVLTNFDVTSNESLALVVSYLRFAFALAVAFSSPVTFFVGRTYLLSLMRALKGAELAELAAEPTVLSFYGLTLGSLGVVMAVCFSVDDMGVVLQFTGAFGSSVLGFLMPALVWFRARQLGYLHSPSNTLTRTLLCAFMFCFGAVVLLSGILESIADIYDDEQP